MDGVTRKGPYNDNISGHKGPFRITPLNVHAYKKKLVNVLNDKIQAIYHIFGQFLVC